MSFASGWLAPKEFSGAFRRKTAERWRSCGWGGRFWSVLVSDVRVPAPVSEGDGRGRPMRSRVGGEGSRARCVRGRRKLYQVVWPVGPGSGFETFHDDIVALMSDISVQTVTCSRSEAAVGDGGFLGEGLADLGYPFWVEAEGAGDGVVTVCGRDPRSSAGGGAGCRRDAGCGSWRRRFGRRFRQLVCRRRRCSGHCLNGSPPPHQVRARLRGDDGFGAGDLRFDGLVSRELRPHRQ